jgi:hypothetical protein
MDGVTIIKTMETAVAVGGFTTPIIAIVGAFLGVGLGLYIAVVAYARFKKELSKPFTGLICMTLAAVGIMIGGAISKVVEPKVIETTYLVELTEELDYKEFTEKYEVIDFRDGYYVVKEKGEE